MRSFVADLEVIPGDGDPIAELKSDLGQWIDSVVKPTVPAAVDDPVFEGMVRDFNNLDKSFRKILKSAEDLLRGFSQMTSSITQMAEALSESIAKTKNVSIVSDACRFKECAANVSRPEAPHSIYAKFRRDLTFNVIEPLQSHIAHNRIIRTLLETRRRRLIDYATAKRELEALERRHDILPNSQSHLKSKGTVEHTRALFEELDFPLFEWLLMLQEYKQDIHDSLLQTIKYLQYEFFAGASHCVSRVLPKRMEFRPLVEMTPAELRPQVQLQLDEDVELFNTLKDDKDDGLGTATTRLLKLKTENDCSLLKRDKTSSTTQPPQIPVDPSALVLLTSQGFDESLARNALKWHNNAIQDAIECMLTHNNHSDEKEAQEPSALQQEVYDAVRIPSTLKWVAKLRENNKQKAEPSATSSSSRSSSSSSNSAPACLLDKIVDTATYTPFSSV